MTSLIAVRPWIEHRPVPDLVSLQQVESETRQGSSQVAQWRAPVFSVCCNAVLDAATLQEITLDVLKFSDARLAFAMEPACHKKCS